MTEKFYRAFLDYMSPKVKRDLCSILQKRKMQVNGYGMVKDAPAKILAPIIAKNENRFLKILQESYLPTYTSQEEAINAISPDTVVDVLTYFSNEQNLDEDLLMSLLTQAEETTTLPPVFPVSNKAKRKLMSLGKSTLLQTENLSRW